jgi:hypothetical protein
MVDPEQLVVDGALHEVEDPPAGEEEADVQAPWRRQLAAVPGADQQNAGHDDQDPGGKVEEAVDEGVRLESGDGVHRLAAVLAREHVMPLEDLMKRDPVDEATKPETQSEGRRGR